MKKIRKLLASLMLFCLCVLGIPFNAKADGIEVTFNPVLDTDDRYPELTGTINDPNAIVTVFVNNNGEMADNLGNGTWVISHYYYPLYDGTYNIRVEAINYDTEESDVGEYLGGLTVKDDYTMPPEIECDLLDISNVNNFVIKAKAESGATVHISVSDGFNKPIEQVGFTDWNGNVTFEPLDLSSLFGGWIAITATAIDLPNEGLFDYTSNTSEESLNYIFKDTESLDSPQINCDSTINQQNQNNFIMSGTTAPNTKINYYFYGVSGPNIFGTMDVDGSGNFSKEIDLSSLLDGIVDLYIGAKLGNQTSKLISVSLLKTVVGPEITDLEIKASSESGFRASFLGKTNPHTKLTYNFKKDDVTIDGETVSDENGDFAVNDIDLNSLQDGDIILSVQAKNENGNIGRAVEKILTKEATLPIDPVIDPDPATDTEVTAGNTQSGVIVTAASAEESSETSSLPVTGPNTSSLLILAGLTMLAGLQVSRLKKDN